MSENTLSVRVNPANLNHHLWNNNGTWFIYYTRHKPGFIKNRHRHSLGTKSLHQARSRRDQLLMSEAMEVCCG